MNMFKPTKATSIEEYLDLLPPERKEPILFLHKFIQKHAPTLKPVFSYNMLGYGNFNDWPTISLASQKNYISLYFCSVVDGEYIAETHKDALGKVSVGKSCVRFKKLEDLNLRAVEKLIKLAAKAPGFGEKVAK